MTVKELFLKLTFDEVAEALQRTHQTDKSINDIGSYKEAFDTLCNLEFNGDGGSVTFDVHDNPNYKKEIPLLANGVEGDLWESIVGKEIVFPENNKFTEAEIAAAILWGATFYGFTNHNRWEPFQKIYSEYGQKAWELEKKLFLPYLRNKETIRTLKHPKGERFPFGLALSMEDWNEIHKHKRHPNRSKRKRFYRLKNRITYLKKLDKRTDALNRIQIATGVENRHFYRKVMEAGSIHEVWLESHTFGKSNRVEYVKQLIEKYMQGFQSEFDDCEDLALAFFSSKENRLTDEELNLLVGFFKKYFNCKEMEVFNGINPELTHDIEIQLIGISSIIIKETEYDD